MTGGQAFLRAHPPSTFLLSSSSYPPPILFPPSSHLPPLIFLPPSSHPPLLLFLFPKCGQALKEGCGRAQVCSEVAFLYRGPRCPENRCGAPGLGGCPSGLTGTLAMQVRSCSQDLGVTIAREACGPAVHQARLLSALTVTPPLLRLAGGVGGGFRGRLHVVSGSCLQV